MSNRDRIARAAEEARLTAQEKATKKATKATTVGRSRPVKSIRMKIVWQVCSAAGAVVKTFPYAEKEAAESTTQALSKSTGGMHVLRPTKVPME